MDSTLDTTARGLDEARSRIATTRQALLAAAPDEPEIQRAIAGLERLEAEVARIEGVIAIQATTASRSLGPTKSSRTFRPHLIATTG